MATSSKFNPSNSTPDRSSFNNGQRGSYSAASMERSGSFRESIENPILSSLPSMSRGSSAMTQGDVMSFLQCLRFDPKSLVAEFKSNRQVEFKRHMSIALGISPDNSPSNSKVKLPLSPSLEELKRVKAALRENSVKARERIKIFNEGLSVLNKFLPTKKRSRFSDYSNERSTAFSSGDRSGQCSSSSKMATPSQAPTSSFELEQQKLEERTKTSIPNKRTRTSMVDLRMDGRSNSVIRASGAVDRLVNAGAVQGEDRTSPVGGEGWEKSKMKKKRSILKPDISSGTLPTKSLDGYREPKQGSQHRPLSDVRSRLHTDTHAFRSGIGNGTAGKSDSLSQQNGLAMQSSNSRTDSDNNSLISDKKDRSIGSDRERLNMKALNKANSRDDFNSASPTSNSKMSASVRAPRSGSGAAPKLSPVVHRATVPNDWEISHCTTKPGTGVGASNRKRTASARSSSPPVAQWAGQRPQKSSRSARRTNFGPIVSSCDDTPSLDTVSEVTANDAGPGSARRLTGNSSQVKLKVEPSTAYTESEESGAADIKFRDKSKKAADETDEKSVQNVQKVSTLLLQSRKSKLVPGEGREDGIRRQGRTGRGFTSTRSLSPMTEKVGNVGNAKQLRSSKLGFESIESKTGRPPTRKLSDRKAYSRQRQATTNAIPEFLGDGQAELLAAANAAINSMQAFPNKFWQQMEPLFGFISDSDIEYIKQQAHLHSGAPIPSPVPPDTNYFGTEPNGIGSIGCEKEMGLSTETGIAVFTPEQLVLSTMEDDKGMTLCQRLMAALISEDEYADFCSSGKEDPTSDSYGSSYELDGEVESNGLSHQSSVNLHIPRNLASNGHMMSSKPDHGEPWSSGVGTVNTGHNMDYCHSSNGILSDKVSFHSMDCSDSLYSNMNVNEKLLLEIQSIGIYPDLEPTGGQTEGGISEEILKLEKQHREAVQKRAALVGRLSSAIETKDIQEKEFEPRALDKFEPRALDKLVEMAYQKYMSCHRSNASGSRSTSNKAAKKAALSFVKWTLRHCHKFEETGKSCFSEPLYKEIYFAGLSHQNTGPQSLGTLIDGESAKQVASTAKVSALQSPSLTSQLAENGDNQDANSADVLLPASYSSEQSIGREDTWSNRVKKKQLLLDDVGGTVGMYSGAASVVGSALMSSTKGKRSDRDREGKGHGREVRNGTAKTGRPGLSNARGERKSKAKPKQKNQLSVSVNGLHSSVSEQPKPASNSVSSSSKMTGNNNSSDKTDFGSEELEDPIDLSQLQLPDMDVLGDGNDQGEDLGSWLNLDDVNLQDQEIMGLEIPMDDLSDVNMLY